MAWSRDLAYSSRKNKLHLSFFYSFILKSYMPLFQLRHRYDSTSLSLLSYRLGYNLPYISTSSFWSHRYDSTSSSLLSYRLGYNLPYISTSSFWSRSPTRLSEPLLDCWLARKDYLQISFYQVYPGWRTRQKV